MDLLNKTIDQLKVLLDVRDALSESRNFVAKDDINRAIDKTAKEAENLIKIMKIDPEDQYTASE